MKENLVINPEITDNNEETLETTLRPQLLEEYIGQTKVKESMKVYIEAAKQRGESLDHVLLYGPPGFSREYVYTHYYRFPKELVYYQVRLSLWICLQRSTSTPFNGLFRQSAALSRLRLHVTP